MEVCKKRNTFKPLCSSPSSRVLPKLKLGQNRKPIGLDYHLKQTDLHTSGPNLVKTHFASYQARAISANKVRSLPARFRERNRCESKAEPIDQIPRSRLPAPPITLAMRSHAAHCKLAAFTSANPS